MSPWKFFIGWATGADLTSERVEEANSGPLDEVVLLALVLRHDEQQDVHQPLVVEKLKCRKIL